MSDMLVEFRLRGGARMVLDRVEFGDQIVGYDRGGRSYTVDPSNVVAEKLLRDRFGRVGRKPRRG